MIFPYLILLPLTCLSRSRLTIKLVRHSCNNDDQTLLLLTLMSGVGIQMSQGRWVSRIRHANECSLMLLV